MHATSGNDWAVGRRTKSPGSPSNRRKQGAGPFLQLRGEPPLVQLIDLCLLSLLFVAPLLMGGRHPVGQLAWMLIAAVLGLATLLHYRPCKPSAGDWIWLAAVALVMLQLVPLSPNVLTWLNPGLSELLPGLTDPSSIPFGEAIYTDRPISINPYRTRLALGMLLAYGAIFHAVTRRVQTIDDVRRLLGWIAAAAVAMATLALAQRFAGNGKFLWVYQHISRSASDAVKGPFQNQNHLAQLMALAIGPLLFFATSRAGQWQTFLASSGATIVLLTGLLTFSRGGVIAIVVAGLVAVAGLTYSGRIDRQRSLRVILPAILTLILLTVWGGQKLRSSVATLTEGADLSAISPARLELWQAHLRAIAASPWVGYGAASHEDIYPAFIEKDFGVKFTHGESGYLPIQLENGLLGSILLAGVFVLIARWAWHSLGPSASDFERDEDRGTPGEKSALAVACLAGFAASTVQSLGDFVWYIPACLTPTLMLLACLFRLATTSRLVETTTFDGQLLSKTRWLAVPVCLLVIAFPWHIGAARASGPWQQFRSLTRASGSSSDLPETHAESIALLKKVLRYDPENPVVRMRFAAALVASCDCRERVPTTPKNDLLNAAMRQIIVALGGAPLRGKSYVVLADAVRQAGADGETQMALLEQAVRVSPSDTEILFGAGLVAFRSGNLGWGLETWAPVMETPSEKRDRLLSAFASIIPADTLLEVFAFDHAALAIVYHHVKVANPTDTQLLNLVGDRLVKANIAAANRAENPLESAAMLHTASCVLREIEGPDQLVIALAGRAVAASPADFQLRLRLANLLIKNGRVADAQKQLAWCRSRRPLDPGVARQERLVAEALLRWQR